MKISIEKILLNPWWLFVLVNILSFIRIFNPSLRNGFALSIISLSMIILFYKEYLKSINGTYLFYFLVQILSFFYYFISSEIRCFVIDNYSVVLKGISYILIPQFFFYASGFIVGNHSEIDIKRNIRIILWSNFVIIFIGIILFETIPDFYNNYLHIAQKIHYSKETWQYPRLISYLDSSMVIGLLSSMSAILSITFINNKYTKVLFIVVFTYGVIASLQRAAWLSLSFGYLYYLVSLISFSKIKLSLNKLKVISLLFTLLVIAIIFYGDVFISSNHELVTRLGKFGSAINERSSQWLKSFEILKISPLGSGLGLLSHKSVSSGFKYIVADGNYFRILGEIGLQGLIIFLVFLIDTRNKLIRQKEKNMLITFYIVIFHAIGNNVFELFYVSFFVWFLFGIHHGKNKYNYRNE